MKKYILAFILSAAVLICSGCSKSEDNSELEELISGLPTMYLDGGADDPEEAKPSYKSITGIITAVAKKNITVKTDDKEYKIATDKEPQIFGGTIEKGLTVTVTYESTQDEEKTITPVTITILDGNTEATDPEEEAVTAQEEISTEAADSAPESSQEEAPEASESETDAASEASESETETASESSATEGIVETAEGSTDDTEITAE
ncbi:MAG: hypothetical protein NC203_01865 [Firmicutes bacterium]|nr:hypothetical protein [[Eubacterium] siraeum]MCM1487089.1 hypothetical protein [Bacillota bacterium]